tara:strand:+ start:2069 stop:3055 length:987 start_codon:yes stop_codon:yes gene_type:complete
MKVLVTGGCGFIGSAVVNRLVAEGDVVDVVDDLSSGDPANLDCEFSAVPPTLLPRYPKSAVINKPLLITGDFSDREILTKVQDSAYDVVYHLAANPRVSYSVKKPVESNETNLHKSVALFKVASDAHTRVVFSSSSAVYGMPARLPTMEDDKKTPESPYGLQKLLCEQYLDLFTRMHKLDAISLRYFNVYGPKALGNSPYSTAIAAWCNALYDKKPLRSDGDGEQSRDMVYIDDVVEANFLAGRSTTRFDSAKVNVATGKRHTNNEILSLITKRVGHLNVSHAPRREGDVKDTQGYTVLAEEVLHFKTQISLSTGLDETLKWWGLIDA